MKNLTILVLLILIVGMLLGQFGLIDFQPLLAKIPFRVVITSATQQAVVNQSQPDLMAQAPAMLNQAFGNPTATTWSTDFVPTPGPTPTPRTLLDLAHGDVKKMQEILSRVSQIGAKSPMIRNAGYQAIFTGQSSQSVPPLISWKPPQTLLSQQLGAFLNNQSIVGTGTHFEWNDDQLQVWLDDSKLETVITTQGGLTAGFLFTDLLNLTAGELYNSNCQSPNLDDCFWWVDTGTQYTSENRPRHQLRAVGHISIPFIQTCLGDVTVGSDRAEFHVTRNLGASALLWGKISGQQPNVGSSFSGAYADWYQQVASYNRALALLQISAQDASYNTGSPENPGLSTKTITVVDLKGAQATIQVFDPTQLPNLRPDQINTGMLVCALINLTGNYGAVQCNITATAPQAGEAIFFCDDLVEAKINPQAQLKPVPLFR